ncbi:hypothetical protein FOA52_013106 [Chlamydomonas sp. UWO 241]|nr:hypothetical protein FOA52_013106 [Chlamydomonas sp. UWO 241]
MRSPSSIIALAVAVLALGACDASHDYNGVQRFLDEMSAIYGGDAPPVYGAYPPPANGAYDFIGSSFLGSRRLAQVSPPYGAYPPPAGSAFPLPTYGAAPPANVAAPLPPGGVDRAPSGFFLPMVAVLTLTPAGCTRAGANAVQFMSLFADATAAAWNSTALCLTSEGGVKCELTGDITDISPSGECFSSSDRRRALLQDGAHARVTARNNVPPSVSESEASGNQVVFQVTAASAYTTGVFADTFGVTGATVQVLGPESSG